MATVNLAQAFSFAATQDWDWGITKKSATGFTISDGIHTQTFTGTFTFDTDGTPHGTVTAMSYLVSGATVYSATGLHLSAEQMYTFATTIGDTQDAYTYMMAGADTINGSIGADRIYGYGGSDLIKAGEGNDTISGGSGNNTLYGDGGNDSIVSSSGNDKLYGGLGNDTLSSGSGNDTLNGGSGTDKMTGGDGNDTYYVNSSTDTVIETSDAETQFDLVLSSVTYTLGANVEDLSLLGATAINGVGNELANLISGSAGANSLAGAAENDTLYGGGGNDSLSGGLGNDFLSGQDGVNRLSGGDGDDTMVGGIGADTMVGGDGNDVYYLYNSSEVVSESSATGGVDYVVSTFSYRLGTNLDGLVLGGTAAINGYGNGLDNTIVGNDAANILSGSDGSDRLEGGISNDTLIGGTGNDVLIGGAGTDQMSGGAGADTYSVDSTTDVVTEVADTGTAAGVDMVYASATFTLGASVENIILIGATAISATGNTMDNALTGNDAANTLSGNAGDDTISGAGGNDKLNGGDGGDAMYGGLGNDSLAGGAGDDVMVGDVGNDTMVGGTGNDTYMVDSASDVLVEAAGGGVSDYVSVGFTWTLAANFEGLLLSGTGAINGTGNASENDLVGNGSSNVLKGLAGNDTLMGMSGDDQLYGGSGNDDLTGGGGNDTFRMDSSLYGNFDHITDFVHGEDKIELSRAIYGNVGPVGTLSAAAFNFGSGANEFDDRIVYQASSGNIWYDADGNGSFEGVYIVNVAPNTVLTASDFVIV